MKVGDIVYWDCLIHQKIDRSVGLLVDIFNNRCSVFAVYTNGKVYVIPRYQIKKVKYAPG